MCGGENEKEVCRRFSVCVSGGALAPPGRPRRDPWVLPLHAPHLWADERATGEETMGGDHSKAGCGRGGDLPSFREKGVWDVV